MTLPKYYQKKRERCEVATPGPWYRSPLYEGDYEDKYSSIGQFPTEYQHYEDTIADVWENPNLPGSNPDFIANARIDLPETLDALEGAVNILEEFKKNMHCQCDDEPEGVPCEYHLISSYLKSLDK